MNKPEDDFADGHISADVLNSTSGRYRQQIETLKKEMEFNKHGLSLCQQYLSTPVDLLSEVSLFYQKANIAVGENCPVRFFPAPYFFPKKKVEHHESTRPFG